MSSGYIPAKDEPSPDEILEALQEAIFDNPRLTEVLSEEVARQLVLGGYLQEEPSPALVELRSKLNSLEERRETAQRELAGLASWSESLEAFERDKDKLLESYATLAPEALAALDPQERRAVYSMLGLCVEALPDKSLRVRGAFGEENLVWEKERTSTR